MYIAINDIQINLIIIIGILIDQYVKTTQTHLIALLKAICIFLLNKHDFLFFFNSIHPSI